jgi:hypothetical protein
MTFIFKQCTQDQCSNNTYRWMTSMFILYEPMKRKFHTTIITKLWPMKFVIHFHIHGLHRDTCSFGDKRDFYSNNVRGKD